jgi:hypothetical protein
LLERHLSDLLHACHISNEELGTVAASASIFRANPIVSFETIVIYSSKALVGVYLLGKISSLFSSAPMFGVWRKSPPSEAEH